MKFAGLDIGTTGCKCTIYSENGAFIAEEYMEYSINISENEHSINPEEVWGSVCVILDKIARKVHCIDAMCVASFGETSVILDEEGNSLMDSLLYTDPNGIEECDCMSMALGDDKVFEITGVKPAKMYSVAKWMWIEKKRPDVWKKMRHICLFEDYIVYKLSGVRQIDYSMAARTMAFNVHTLEWSQEILEFANVKPEMLSKPAPMGTIAGPMKEELQARFGLQTPTLIVSGTHDQVVAAIGTGVLKSRQAVDGAGTVECITSVFTKEDHLSSKVMQDCGYAVIPYIDDTYVTYAFSYTGGALLKWYRDKMAHVETELIQKEGKSPYDEFNKSVNENCPTGLLILPHFAGAGTPYMNELAQGVIWGMTLETTKEDIYQALMESVAYEMKVNLKHLKEAGIEIDEIYATGGGANSKKWLQMKANILGKKVTSLGAAQSGTLGCIMLAAVASGAYANLEEAIQVFVHFKESYLPIEESVQKYNIEYEKYSQMYSKLYL